jgi:predicted GNAT family acetyltransferase
MNQRLRNNKKLSVFEFKTNGDLAKVMYAKRNDILYLNYALVPSQLRGQGIGAEMMEAVLKYARENTLKVVPICSYTVRYMNSHREWEDLIYES